MSRSKPKDYYRILQVHPEAETEIIEAAYRRLAKKYHPDIDNSPVATARMQDINEAYGVLSHALSRADFDRLTASGTSFRATPICPRDAQLLSIMDAWGAAVSHCSQCQGLWINNMNLRDLHRLYDHPMPNFLTQMGVYEQRFSVSRLNCPDDGSRMLLTDIQDVEIDLCGTCVGVWLDRGELKKLLSQASDSVVQKPRRPAVGVGPSAGETPIDPFLESVIDEIVNLLTSIDDAFSEFLP